MGTENSVIAILYSASMQMENNTNRQDVVSVCVYRWWQAMSWVECRCRHASSDTWAHPSSSLPATLTCPGKLIKGQRPGVSEITRYRVQWPASDVSVILSYNDVPNESVLVLV